MTVTQSQIEQMLVGMGIPVTYHHFETEQGQEPPFLVYLFPESDNMAADNRVYQKLSELNVEIYTDVKSVELESRMEKILDEAGLFWDKTEIWIESERLYEVLYEMEVLMDEEK